MSGRLFVKVCGITREEDALLGAELGATAIGFVFWPNSPRFIDAARAREIRRVLPPSVAAVGVFVDQSVEEVRVTVETARLNAVQLHGSEDATRYRALAPHTIKAVAVRGGATSAVADGVPSDVMVLLDVHDPALRGGTGRTVDWHVARTLCRQRPAILSGGLNAENVEEAIRTVAPYGIDVSSGVEIRPGVKSPERLRQFLEVVRRMGAGS